MRLRKFLDRVSEGPTAHRRDANEQRRAQSTREETRCCRGEICGKEKVHQCGESRKTARGPDRLLLVSLVRRLSSSEHVSVEQREKGERERTTTIQ